MDTVESGKMTKDRTVCIHGKDVKPEYYLYTEDFLDTLDRSLKARLE